MDASIGKACYCPLSFSDEKLKLTFVKSHTNNNSLKRNKQVQAMVFTVFSGARSASIGHVGWGLCLALNSF